jgi:hypothetical protein
MSGDSSESKVKHTSGPTANTKASTQDQGRRSPAMEPEGFTLYHIGPYLCDPL